MTLKVKMKKTFKDFSLKIDFETEKKWQGILGASGCGKSLTLKLIAGIETPDEGKIILGDRVLFDSEKKINVAPQKRKVGYLFQNYALFPNMTVRENLLCGLGKGDEKYVEELLSLLQIEKLKGRFPRKLSGGQQQRVALARCLVSKPDIILLDEPFSALDEFLREKLQQEVKEVLKKFNSEVLLVTHSRDEVYNFCEKIIVLNEGKMITKGTKEEVFENPKDVIAAKLSGCKNLSRIKKIGNNKLKAIDWNVVLETREEIKENIKYVGIRAHDIKAEEGENAINCNLVEVQEGLFENTIVYSLGKGSIWWKIAKSHWKTPVFEDIPRTLRLPANKLLLLTGGENEKN